MASAPLNWLLKIGGDALTTTAQTLSAAINELKTAISGKQDSLTFDNTPTENSNNPVTSDGVFDALATKVNSSDLATVATTGSYNDLEDLPTDTGMATDGSNADSEVTFAGAFTVGSRAGTVGTNSTAMGSGCGASGHSSHAEGRSTTASGNGAHAEGYAHVLYGPESIQAEGNGAHAEGSIEYTGSSAHTGHYIIQATGVGAHAEGCISSTSSNGAPTILSSGKGAHAEGYVEGSSIIQATGKGAHAEGYANSLNTVASGNGAHAEGMQTAASGNGAHAEGCETSANGSYSHAEGYDTSANADYSHAGGQGVRAGRNACFVHGYKSYSKFRNVGMLSGYCAFGFQAYPGQYTTDASVTAYDDGVSGIIYDTATVSITLARQAMYLLVCSTYTTSSGALYGETVRLITAAGADSGTPVNLSLGQTSAAPATVATAANNVLTIKNGAAARATQFTLIRVL